MALIFPLFILITFLIIVVGSYRLYVSVIQKKNKVQEAFSCVDVQLKKRYDLIPNILTIASKYMEHEKSILEEVTKLRTRAVNMSDLPQNNSEKIKLDRQIKGLMGQIMVSFENYPDLKADQTMIIAMQTYNEIEEHISAARRFYNSAVLELNNAVEIFPSSIFAALVGATKQNFYEIDERERKAIDARNYLK